jgi:lipopolysaccharide transport system permease protein
MAKQDVVGRYKGSLFGILWSFLNPLIMLIVYSFVFGLVFKAKWGVATDQNFAVILFSGLIMHGLLAECLMRAPGIVVGNVSYVKKVVFPLESLAWVSVFSSLFHCFISLVILYVAILVTGGSVSLTWLYLPVVLFPLLMVCVGISWLLAALGVYIKDVAQMTGILATILLFLCPIFYPIEVIPESYRNFILLNPLSFIVEQARSILVFGIHPNIFGLFKYLIIACVFAQLCLVFFSKVKKGFSDVL